MDGNWYRRQKQNDIPTTPWFASCFYWTKPANNTKTCGHSKQEAIFFLISANMRVRNVVFEFVDYSTDSTL